jgi:hypothetical protein
MQTKKFGCTHQSPQKKAEGKKRAMETLFHIPTYTYCIPYPKSATLKRFTAAAAGVLF